MARGYPDYFGYSTFFKYGQLQTPAPLVAAVLAGDTNDIWHLDYKGRTYSGWLRLTFLADPANLVTTFCSIDGNEGYRLNTMLTWAYHLSAPGLGPLELIYYDDVGTTIVYRIANNWSFDSNFTISVENLTAAGIAIQGELWVARVT